MKAKLAAETLTQGVDAVDLGITLVSVEVQGTLQTLFYFILKGTLRHLYDIAKRMAKL